jgi:hypothetical protein
MFSSTSAAAPTVRHGPLRAALAALETVTGVAAVYGGAMLIADAWRLPVADLAPLPLRSWVIPGAALILTVAVPMAIAAVAVWRRSAWAAAGSIAAGLILAGWVLVQVAVIGPQMFLQAVLFVTGLVIAALGAALRNADRPS